MEKLFKIYVHMAYDQILTLVVGVIEEVLELTPQITSKLSAKGDRLKEVIFKDDLDGDSLSGIIVEVGLENKFSITLADGVVSENPAITIGGIADMVQAALQSQS